MHGRANRALACEVGRGREHTEEFLARADDALRVGTQELEVRRLGGEVTDDAGDRVDHRVAPAGEDDTAEAEHLRAGEPPALEPRARERAEEIGPRVCLRAVEQAVGVGLHLGALARAVALAEDVRAPADPHLGLRARHIHQDGQPTRLERDGELAHDLDLGSRQRGGDQAIHQRLHLGNHFRLLGAVEIRLRDVAVFLLRGRVHLQRELLHGADILLGGDRYLERRVGAELLPVLGGAAHVLVAEQHGNLVALEIIDKHAILAARLLEGIRLLVVEWARHGV